MSTSGAGSIFNGTSRYATDFQQIIARSVAIASLPMAQMQTQKIALGDQSAAMSGLDARFTSLQSALNGLGSATASYSSSISDGAIASTTVASGAFQGVYSLEVVDLGSYASGMSTDGLTKVGDPAAASISASSNFTLTVGGVSYEIVPAANTLVELAKAINASPAAVDATIVNIGSSLAPDYRLSVTSTKLGAVPVQVNDGTLALPGTDLLGTASGGAPATYRVNGQPALAIESDSRSVAIAPGLTVTMLKAGTAQITVAHDTQAVSNALAAIASAYNAAVDEIDKYHGEDAGALRGSSMLYTLSQSLRDLIGYSSGSGALSSLSSLGLGFDGIGKLSLDTAAFNTATDGQFEALSSLLGSSSTGGFMKYASDLMTGLEDSTKGVVKTAVSSLQAQLAQQDARIAEEQTRIDSLEKNLEARMAAADALIASMEQQVIFMNGLIDAMSTIQRNGY